MKTYSLSHLSDQTLLRELKALVTQERGATAAILAHVAEVDARKLYLPAAYPSMYLYCVHELRLSEDCAFKRIRAARAARRFPTILESVAEGRLTLSAVVQLAPYLTEGTAEGLLASATHKTNAAVEQLLADRFPRPDMPTRVVGIGSTQPTDQLAARPVGMTTEQLSPGTVGMTGEQLAAGPVRPPAALLAVRPVGTSDMPVAGPVKVPTEPPTPGIPEAPRPRVTPLAPQRFALQLTMGQGTHDKLRHVQALLGHQIPSGDVAQVLDRALDALIRELEKARFAATDQPRRGRRRSVHNTRHIPADVKRAVWERDGGRCTFVSDTGLRCAERKLLEYDHIDPVARGGEASVARVRLRCRAHNQFEAERTFGAEFMRHKRRAAAEARAAASARAATTARNAAG